MGTTTRATGMPRHELPSAIEAFGEIAARIGDTTPAMFLDYDGVLTPIVAHPDLAVMSDEMRLAVARLASLTTVAVVSGRDMSDVRSKVDVPSVIFAGSHGFDIVDPSGNSIGDLNRFDSYVRPLQEAADAVESQIGRFDGAHVERKRFAVAVHFRQADPSVEPDIERLVHRVAGRRPELRVTGGKKIFEFRPNVEWDKGRALEWLLEELHLDRPDVIPLYLGDDVTDEDAFRAIRTRGIGVVVGTDGAPSLAHYRLDDTDDVERFLARLHQELSS